MAQIEHLGQPEQGRRPGPPPEPPTLPTRVGRHAVAGHGPAAAGARRMEQAIVRVDPRSVLNLSLAFFRRMLILGLGLGALLWVGAFVTGAASSIDTFIQDLTGYPSLSVLGFRGLLVALVLGLTFVVGVDRASPAYAAGLEAGDVIVSVDGTTVDSPASLSSAINGHDTHAAIDMSWVDQKGRYRTAIVHLGARSG